MGRVTDDERREVAENLRYLADYPVAPVRYAEQFRDELFALVLPDGFTHDYSELFTRLADLIEPQPERTCRIKPNENFDVGEPPYICDACGATIDTKFFFMDGLRVHEFRYCPNCRSKAVEDD